jgi:transketolase
MDPQEMRFAYCDLLREYFDKGAPVMALDADLMSALGIRPLWERYPDHIINCGIQEANMIGVAAGLAKEGKIPFAHSFGAFASRRDFDQVFMSCAYAGTNVKIVGSDPGVASVYNGGTHAANEDVALMRTIPGITIVEPTDTVMLQSIIRGAAEKKGVFYIRLYRRNRPMIYEPGSVFEIGKAALLREGSDVTIIASGIEVYEAIQAAKILESEGIHARVLDMFTVKPLDEDAVLRAAAETGAVVTAENHTVIGGLSGAVAELLVENCPVPMERIGIHDEFGEVGPLEWLMERFCLRAEDIADKVRRVIRRKLLS